MVVKMEWVGFAGLRHGKIQKACFAARAQCVPWAKMATVPAMLQWAWTHWACPWRTRNAWGVLGAGIQAWSYLAQQRKSSRPPTQARRQAEAGSRHREAGLEACFEQVAQGLWLVRRVHRRSKTISLPGRLKLPTLRLTASRSNQLSYGSLCRRPKLVPVLEKRLNNSWLQMVCQTKGQQPK